MQGFLRNVEAWDEAPSRSEYWFCGLRESIRSGIKESAHLTFYGATTIPRPRAKKWRNS